MIGLYVGESQIDYMKAGNSLTSCEPRKRLDEIDRNLVPEQLKAIGQVFDVADEEGEPRLQATLKDCFITTYGNPDMRLITGLGFKEVSEFQNGYSEFWKANFPKAKLLDTTELFISVWVPVQSAEATE